MVWVGRDRKDYPKGTPRDSGAPNHIYLTKYQELRAKETKQLSSSEVTAGHCHRMNSAPKKIHLILNLLLFTRTPQEPLSSYKNTGVEFQPAQPGKVLSQKSLFSLLYFFLKTVLHLLKSALKSAWVSDPALGTEISMPVWNRASGSDQCCRAMEQTAQENVPLQSQMENGQH